MKIEKHEFALFTYGLSNLLDALPANGQLCIKSKEVHHRITRVLRLSTEETIILFDRVVHARCQINQLKSKDEVDLIVLSHHKNKPLKPSIVFGLPLLKRSALEDTVYGLVEVGVNTIQLLTTEKSQQRWHGDTEYSRLERIMISAAEQSKNFAFPGLRRPILLHDFLDTLTNTKSKTIFFDPSGQKISKVISLLASDIIGLTLLIGPEADLSEKEKMHLQKSNIDFCALTPTILRAQQAAVLSSGIFRSFF